MDGTLARGERMDDGAASALRTNTTAGPPALVHARRFRSCPHGQQCVSFPTSACEPGRLPAERKTQPADHIIGLVAARLIY